LYLFAALVRLRRMSPDNAGGVMIPGGMSGAMTVAGVGFAATVIAIALTFLPPPGSHAMAYETNLIVQSVAMLGLGGLLYRLSRRSSRSGRYKLHE
jgi:hypothetical protein